MHPVHPVVTTTSQTFPHIPQGAGQAYNVIGERLTIKVTSDETGGRFAVLELASPPQGGPPLHTHPSAETFTITEGTFEFSGLRDGERYTIRATPGDTVYIPAEAPHTYTVIGDTPGKSMLVLAPGDEMVAFFAEAGVPIDGQVPIGPAGPPTEAEIGRMIAIAEKHGLAFMAS
jgi:quercetin dioxygenase-like cupin family protein